LEGLDELDAATVVPALSDSDPKVRAAAVRLSEPVMKTQDRAAIVPAILKKVADEDPDVQLQLAFTLGEVHSPEADAALTEVGSKESANPYICEAILSSLGGKELETLVRAFAQETWKEKLYGREKLVFGLARCVFVERRTNRIDRLMSLAAAAEPWQRAAILDGMLATAPVVRKGRASRPVKPVRFAAQPDSFLALKAAAPADESEKIERFEKLVTWPGQEGYVPPPYVVPLTAAQQKQFDLGKNLFTATCAVCHQPHGLGQEGLAPPLAGSEWVLGPEERMIRIVLNGARGRFNVMDRAYELEMPALGVFADDQIAAILTYARREWENTADPVEAASIARVRAAIAGREEGWSEPELLKITGGH
jgi:mono/diheme cytochrome c family protein